MQISNVQASQQPQTAQRLHNQNTGTEGSKSEEANESVSKKAAEAQRGAVAQSTGVGLSIDAKI